MTPREAYIQANINGVFSLTGYDEFTAVYGEEWYRVFMSAPFYEDVTPEPDISRAEFYAAQAYDALPEEFKEWSVEAHLVAARLAGAEIQK